jgi:uncharacterized phiE125 gp8 family phage protein
MTDLVSVAPFYANNRNPFNYSKFEQVSRDTVTSWLTLDEITQQLNLFQDESQDAYLQSLELATRMAIEDYLGMAICSTQYRVYYGNFGLYNTSLYLDLPEVSRSTDVTINSVQVYSTSATTATTMASSTYSYDSTGNRVIVNSLPTLSQDAANPIVVTYTQNPTQFSAYPVIKQAGLMLLTHLYNNRSNTTEGNLKEIPYGVAALLRPYKPLVL